jgi:hypothetical protein
MRVHLDFEASSLSDESYPIEVGWVFEDGTEGQFLIRPATDWTDWSTEAEAIHGISRATLDAEGTPHNEVAARLIETLAGHNLLASAPPWDGKWMSVLLRAAGLPRHALRLNSSKVALRREAARLLADTVAPAELPARAFTYVERILRGAPPPRHRALDDARDEHRRWLALRDAIAADVAVSPGSGGNP